MDDGARCCCGVFGIRSALPYLVYLPEKEECQGIRGSVWLRNSSVLFLGFQRFA